MSDGVQLEIAPRQVVDGLLAHGWVVGNQQQVIESALPCPFI